MSLTQYVILQLGWNNLTDEVIGPFNSEEAADAYAASNNITGYMTMELVAPHYPKEKP